MNESTFTSTSFDICYLKQEEERLFRYLTGHHRPNTSYYSEGLFRMRMSYSCYHGYVTVPICAFGILSNILNIVVFSRKRMVSFMNILLTGLAIADLSGMLTYIPYVIYFYISGDSGFRHSYSLGWSRFHLFNMHFTITSVVSASWVTIAIGTCRLVAVKHPLTTYVTCSHSRARWILTSLFVGSIILMLPLYLSFTVGELLMGTRQTYGLTYTELAKEHNLLLVRITFWIAGLFIKVLPCVILTGLSISLMIVLHKAKRNRVQALHVSERHTEDRTSNMLLTVLIFYVITELPSGVLVVVSGLLGEDFINNVFLNFNEITDALTLLNKSSNIVIYLAMSSKYRKEFLSIFISQSKQVSQSTDTSR